MGSKKKADPPVMGRPKIIIEEAKLRTFMRMKPSLEDAAAFFECSDNVIEARIKELSGLTFREFREQNMVHTRHMLVRTALRKAEDGDNTMLIFCLKNLCKWADKFDHEVKSEVTQKYDAQDLKLIAEHVSKYKEFEKLEKK